jgi:hypothetical protein
MSEQSKMALRDNALSLARYCPVEQSNPDDCPLFAVRKLKPARRRQWFDILTEDDLSYLNAYHSVCARIKMESRCGRNPQPSLPLPPPSDFDPTSRG